MRVIDQYQAILLDAQKTFVFGGNRFGRDENYHATYCSLGGNRLDPETVNRAVAGTETLLWDRYNDSAWFENFPSLRQGFEQACPDLEVDERERELLEKTFAIHERGLVPPEFAECIRTLARTHRLGVVSNIWAKKDVWLEDFREKGILDLFEVMVFSSDIGSIKPAAAPFERALSALRLAPSDVLFAGDSPAGDIAGAGRVGMKTVLTLNRGPVPKVLDPAPDHMVRSLTELPELRV